MPRNYHTFDVIVIGGGTAGISALKEALKHTANAIMVHDGPFGTSCIRTACMPSKSFIHAATLFHQAGKMEKAGIFGADALSVDLPTVLDRVRKLRDHFLSHINQEIKSLETNIVKGKAKLETPTCIRLQNRLLHAKNIVIATGSSPHIPKDYRPFSKYFLTTDTLFEQKDLPQRIGVVGLGPVGIEMAQTFARLGIEVTAVNLDSCTGGLDDPVICQDLLALLASDMAVWTGANLKMKEHEDGLLLKDGRRRAVVDKVLMATGRQPALKWLKLERLGMEMDEHGIPRFDPHTMKIHNMPLYLTGDASDDRALLHEAVDEGKRAAYHASTGRTDYPPRKVPLSIVFTHPALARVGEGWDATRKPGVITGEASFENQGRALIEQKNEGKMHLYADGKTGRLLGAELVSPDGEHLAHLIAWAIQQDMTASDLLQMPFYHPTIEEGLKTALLSIIKQLKQAKR